ncbi:HIG1 domain-containing protein [Sphingomonas morindae]|uniref:HIG1 domain-containing protein n=1 Tax=Sphingomonas morindae TaxID=1541170 RepID=A0ABY4XB65_9SPHN|nr:HIG1 domain-containing protein [Sphingomonas morindae]USI74199.1 HIG1 domain-containing protein [Sphingomonas morindae]
MTILLTLLVIVFALAALGALVRGIVIFLRTEDSALRRTGEGPSRSGLRQNRMMWRRIQFQFLAVAAAVLLLLLIHPRG